MNSQKYSLTILVIAAALLFSGLQDHGFRPLFAAKKTKEVKDNTFSLNFNDVEISEFVNVMSQIIGKNIIL